MRATFLLVVSGLACALAVLLTSPSASAIPRFSIREGLPCTTCHVNPSGGGMRNRYGRYVYAPTQLPATWLGPQGNNPVLDADIGDSLALGGDARAAWYDQRPPKGENLRTIFMMQADLYVAADLSRGLTLYYDQGAWGSFEAMLMYQHDLGAPWASFYAKAGRFMPTYGLRLENHNVYTRQDIGFGPRDKDQGLEVGLYLGPLLIQGAVLNGTTAEKQLDDNHDKALVGRTEVLGRLGPLRLMAGGSVYSNATGSVTNIKGSRTDSRSDHLLLGAHWGAALGRIAYLGEVDLVKVDPSADNKQDSKSHTLQSYQELDILLVRGLELNLNYEERDPDLEHESGRIRRVAAGLELYPLPQLEIKTLYRQTFGGGPANVQQVGLKEFIGMIHVFF